MKEFDKNSNRIKRMKRFTYSTVSIYLYKGYFWYLYMQQQRYV